MAESFDVADMPVTSRYAIPYPGPDNLVRFAADQFGAMAAAIDTQLGKVDDRQTSAARATIVRDTLADLQAATAVEGQFGYVTADTTVENIGIWVYSGSAWSRVSGATPLTVVRETLASLQEVTNLSAGVFGLVTNDTNPSNNGAYVYYDGSWSPVTSAATGALTVGSYEEMQATSGNEGAICYVTGDPNSVYDGMYIMNADNEWEPIIAPGNSGETATFTVYNFNSGTVVANDVGDGTYVYDIGTFNGCHIVTQGSALNDIDFQVMQDGEYKGSSYLEFPPGVYDTDGIPYSYTLNGRIDGSKQDCDYSRVIIADGGESVVYLDGSVSYYPNGFIVLYKPYYKYQFDEIYNMHTDWSRWYVRKLEPINMVSPPASSSNLVSSIPPSSNPSTPVDVVIDAPSGVIDEILQSDQSISTEPSVEQTDDTSAPPITETTEPAEPAADMSTTDVTETVTGNETSETTVTVDAATAQATTLSAAETTTTPAVAHTLPEWPTTGTEAE